MRDRQAWEQQVPDIWTCEYQSKQAPGVGVAAALSMPVEFGMLRSCMQREYECNASMRQRFTELGESEECIRTITPAEEGDIGDVILVNLAQLGWDEAEDIIQRWCCEVSHNENLPLFEFCCVRLPHGYNGFVLRVDRRLMDLDQLRETSHNILRTYELRACGND